MEDEKIRILKQYCGNIEERIKACRSRSVAEMLKQRMCSELVKECKSDIVVNVLISHIDKLIAQNFNNEGRNLYLEDNT